MLSRFFSVLRRPQWILIGGAVLCIGIPSVYWGYWVQSPTSVLSHEDRCVEAGTHMGIPVDRGSPFVHDCTQAMDRGEGMPVEAWRADAGGVLTERSTPGGTGVDD